AFRMRSFLANVSIDEPLKPLCLMSVAAAREISERRASQAGFAAAVFSVAMLFLFSACPRSRRGYAASIDSIYLPVRSCPKSRSRVAVHMGNGFVRHID